MAQLDPAQAPTRTRARRSEARRTIETVLESARLTLAEQPAASMADIAERSGVHRSTLHRHFPTREALIAELAVAAATAYERRIIEAEVDSGDAREALRRATAAVLDEGRSWRVARYAPLLTYAGQEVTARFRQRTLGIFERGQREATIRADVPAMDLYLGWLGLWVSWGVFRETDSTPEQAADDILRILLPESRPIVLNIRPQGRTADAPARLILEADGDVQLRLELDNTAITSAG